MYWCFLTTTWLWYLNEGDYRVFDHLQALQIRNQCSCTFRPLWLFIYIHSCNVFDTLQFSHNTRGNIVPEILRIHLWCPSGEESMESISKGQANLERWLGEANQMGLLPRAISIDTLWLAAMHHDFCQSLSGIKQSPVVGREKPSVPYLFMLFLLMWKQQHPR